MKLARLVTVSLLVLTFLMSTAWAADKPSHSQTTCPVMGGKINNDVYADYEGKRIYFGFEYGTSTTNNDPAKYVTKLEGEGVTLETASTGGHDHDHDKHSTSK